MNKIDVSYNFRADIKDPRKFDVDRDSEYLHRYHHILWSRKFKGKRIFDINLSLNRPYYFNWNSQKLTSDSIINTFRSKKNRIIQSVIKEFSEKEMDEFQNIGSTIGGFIIFPGRKINHSLTINQSRGLNYNIKDRFDLTLECIRLYYLGESGKNPLSGVFKNYASFFNLFGDFKVYVDFFLLQDLVDVNYEEIKFWLNFKGFGKSSPIPLNYEDYRSYKENVIRFINKRNHRISLTNL